MTDSLFDSVHYQQYVGEYSDKIDDDKVDEYLEKRSKFITADISDKFGSLVKHAEYSTDRLPFGGGIFFDIETTRPMLQDEKKKMDEYIKEKHKETAAGLWFNGITLDDETAGQLYVDEDRCHTIVRGSENDKFKDVAVTLQTDNSYRYGFTIPSRGFDSLEPIDSRSGDESLNPDVVKIRESLSEISIIYSVSAYKYPDSMHKDYAFISFTSDVPVDIHEVADKLEDAKLPDLGTALSEMEQKTEAAEL